LEATQFACNLINVGEHIVMGKVETDLASRLRLLGYDVAEIDLSEFQRGGGSAKALALRLSDTSVAAVTA
jgi:ornithine--oxo-acid transaminase